MLRRYTNVVLPRRIDRRDGVRDTIVERNKLIACKLVRNTLAKFSLILTDRDVGKIAVPSLIRDLDVARAGHMRVKTRRVRYDPIAHVCRCTDRPIVGPG